MLKILSPKKIDVELTIFLAKKIVKGVYIISSVTVVCYLLLVVTMLLV